MRRAYVGLDCGTQSTKAVLVDAADGGILSIGRADHETIERADGTREQWPEHWIEATVAAARDALGRTHAVTVAGIGVSGQQHGLVALGIDDRPVRPAKLWNDTTTAMDGERLMERLGGRERMLELTGNLMLPGYTAPKVAWLRRALPQAYAASRRFCLPHDYLNLWLTGEFVTEPGDASGTAWFDVRARAWSEPVLAALDPDRDWAASLPGLIDSRSVAGELREAAAEALGIEPGVPVGAGGGDNMCAAIGVGAVIEGPVVVSLGTSGVAFAHRVAPAVDPQGEAAAFCDSTGGWLPLSCVLNCTGATDWSLELTGFDRAGFERALDESTPGAGGLTFVPHLEGERTPHHPNGAGLLVGLRRAHGPETVVRAVAEGVTFGIRYGLDALRRTGVVPAEVTLVGGGARSDAWGQLCADVLELPVDRPDAVEAAAVGAALQARWTVEGVPPGRPAVERRWEPRPSAELEEAWRRAGRMRRLAIEEGL